MSSQRGQILLCAAVVLVLLGTVSACSRDREPVPPLEVPRGYSKTITLEKGGQLLNFGPFVGYYFRPRNPGDLSRLEFICFNERSYYTLDLPENTRIFEGEAVLQTLDDVGFSLPEDDRINPVMFAEVPAEWLEKRPVPQDDFVHFHSAYDAVGPVLTGYWIKHIATAGFTYDMGGRVGEQSVLYHEVTPGVDKAFARIVEFDSGPVRR